MKKPEEKITIEGEWARYAKSRRRIGEQNMVNILWHLDLKDPELAQKVRKELGRAIPLHPRLR